MYNGIGRLITIRQTQCKIINYGLVKLVVVKSRCLLDYGLLKLVVVRSGLLLDYEL